MFAVAARNRWGNLGFHEEILQCCQLMEVLQIHTVHTYSRASHGAQRLQEACPVYDFGGCRPPDSPSKTN